MLKVLDPTSEDNRETSEGAVPTLIETRAAARDADGRRLVVRNGRAQSRKVTCGAGTMKVRAPA